MQPRIKLYSMHTWAPTAVLGIALLLGGCSREKMAPGPTLQAPAPAPGTVELKGSIQTCEPGDRMVICSVEVNSVDRYGAGTTQFPSGTIIQVSFRRGLKTPNGDEVVPLLDTARVLDLTIRRVLPPDSTTTLPAWQATRAVSATPASTRSRQ